MKKDTNPKSVTGGGQMEREEVERLALYNAECARGIVHSEEWKAEMEKLQSRFNAEMLSAIREDGSFPLRGRSWFRSRV